MTGDNLLPLLKTYPLDCGVEVKYLQIFVGQGW